MSFQVDIRFTFPDKILKLTANIEAIPEGGKLFGAPYQIMVDCGLQDIKVEQQFSFDVGNYCLTYQLYEIKYDGWLMRGKAFLKSAGNKLAMENVRIPEEPIIDSPKID